MQKLFKDTRLLDKATVEKFGLTEDIMMENAASSLEKAVFSCAGEHELFSGKKKGFSVLILCGSGNNGGDGYVLARRIAGKNTGGFSCRINVSVFAVKPAKSAMCILQAERAQKAGVKIFQLPQESKSGSELDDTFIDALKSADIIVDCIYGSGFHGKLDAVTACLLEYVNKSDACKIACDIPSGIDSNGFIETVTANQPDNSEPLAFKADITVTMGALKTALYSDFAKDFCGKIICADLGVSGQLFETSDSSVEPDAFVLEKSDLVLPVRKKQNANKGSFGHTAIICGEKPGAAIIAGTAAFEFGSGLVTLVLTEKLQKAETSAICIDGELPVACPAQLMQSPGLPKNTKAIAAGMGLGVNSESAGKFLSELFARQTGAALDRDGTNKSSKEKYIPIVFDADMFSRKEIVQFLEKSNLDKTPLVLTPHPKEFSSLLNLTGFGDFSVAEIVKDRINLSKTFVKNYPYCVLLLKGANVCITCKDGSDEKDRTVKTFINPFGDSCIAKGGSGDVLAGLIASLLAQGYSPFEATKNASLAHALAAGKMSGSYNVTPFSLIEQIGRLEKQ